MGSWWTLAGPDAWGAASREPEKISAARSLPLRPGATRVAAAAPAKPVGLPVTRFKKTDYVPLPDLAAAYGYKTSWDAAKRELTLTHGARTMIFTQDRREVLCDGLRVFLGDPVVAKDGKLFVGRTDYERGLRALLRPDMAGTPPGPVKVIALDPGHGGDDPGMENIPLKLQEKALTLDVALRLEKLLKAQGYKVVLTRRDDRHLSGAKLTKVLDWQQRSIIANKAGADLFISIHFNSLFPNTAVGGTETFVFTRPGQRSDQSLGLGQSDDTETVPVPVNAFDSWSMLAAHSMQSAVLKKLGTNDRGLKTKHSAPLRALNCPAVLVESLFLSYEPEARNAAEPAYRQKIAEALADGVRNYAGTLDALRPGTASAPASATAAAPATSGSP